MPEDKEWLSSKEVADLLNVPVTRIYNAVSALRRMNNIETMQDPDNYSITLIKATSLEAIKKFLRIK
jgi:sugar-specific transcriptional regulator TrmB